jgi:hypothetical protein
MSESAMRVVEETPAYWKVVFDYPPFNIVEATIFQIPGPPVSARSNGRQPEPARRRIRERES